MVHPGADVSQIVFRYENVDSTEIDDGGNLMVLTSFGDLVHRKPSSFQMIDGKRNEVDVKFIRLDDGCYGFQAKEYDANYTLIIDPLILNYSTYLGGTGADTGYGIAVDSYGCAYIIGNTTSTDFPTLNQYQGDQPFPDVIVTKLSASGNSLVYSTYLGGNGTDDSNTIAVDASGCAYIAGYTDSTDFPTLNQYQVDQSSYDGFVTKLSASGSSLIYSTYLGGNNYDYIVGIAVDSSGCAYVTGPTSSTDFPTLNQYQGHQSLSDAFVTKLSASGSSLIYSTYLGGNDNDEGLGITLDSSGCAYVTGHTDSADFPTLNRYQGDQPGADVFVTKLSASGNSLVYSTYLGGNDWDACTDIAVDSAGCAYITGQTYSTDFPILNEYQGDQPNADVFVTKLSVSGSSLVYSTYLGGNNNDYSGGIALDSSGAAYIVGATGSADFPTQNPYQANKLGGYDVFVSKLTWRNPNTAPVAVISADRFGGIAPVTITFDGSGSYDPNGTVVAWHWNFGDGETADDMQVTHIYYTPGTYEVTLTVKDNGGLWSDAARATVMVFETADGLSFIITIDPESIKANGKGSADISATGYSASGISKAPGDMPFIPVNLGIIFTLSSGTLDGGMNFDPLTGRYTQNLISGDPGTAAIGVTLDGFALASADINYTWPQPPANISVKMDVNRSLFRGEYFPTISWSANPSEIYVPSAYKIYRSTNGGAMELIGTVAASTFTYSDERLPAGNTYSYSVSMVDSEGDESSLSSPVSAQ
jgi:PKD repeat protein